MYAVGDEGGNVVVQDLRAVVEKTVAYQPHNRFVTSLAFSFERSVWVRVCMPTCGHSCAHADVCMAVSVCAAYAGV